MFLLWTALAVAGAPESLLAEARSAEREGHPQREHQLCTALVQQHPDSPQASVCASRLEALDAVSESGDLSAYRLLEQARRGQVAPALIVPLVDSPSPELAEQAAQWLAQPAHQSAVYARIDARRRVLAWASAVSLALLAALSWPLGRRGWSGRPRLVGVGLWGALCVPTVALVQLYGGLSPRLWALLPAGAGVFVLAAGPAVALRGAPRALWGLLSAAGALGSSFLVLHWAQALHWVGL